MSTSSPDTSHSASERRAAVWPWLLVPLATLALFFTLRSFREMTEQPFPASGIGAETQQSSSGARP